VANEYSDRWFDVFLRTMSSEQTRREVDFLARLLPLEQFPRIVDVCCGSGRHARLLADRGYRVLGIDRDPSLFALGPTSPESLTFIAADMRALGGIPGGYDAVVNLWASFGYFDEDANRDVLAQMAARLRPHGRLVLDVYHRGFFTGKDGRRMHRRDDIEVVETNRIDGRRLLVRLDYPDGPYDEMDWLVYTPDELVELAASVGLRPIARCTRFTISDQPSPDEPRMQLAFERVP
jgi:SAM-dependent methyltransferase